MNSSQLKYGEIFCFLTLFFLILFLFLSHQQQKSGVKNTPSPNSGREKTKFPPIITIDNAKKYPFPLGQANLTPKLKKYIDEKIVPQIEDSFRTYRDINTIEVIGHTDGLEVSGNSNLDKLLNKVATQNRKIGDLQAGSNADLGLMRALAVIEELQHEEPLLQVFKNKGIDKDKVFRAYSAAQLYLPSGKIAPPDPKANQERRRIEIRFTKLNYEDKTKE